MNPIQEEILSLYGNKLRQRVGGICIDGDTVLLVKHINLGEKGILWSPPGGGMQVGESAHQALKREFLEETGLVIDVGRLLFVNEFLAMPLHAIELFFEVKILEGQLKTGTDPEMKNQQQLIEHVEFISFEKIKMGDIETYHTMFKNVQSAKELLELKGYFINGNIS